MSWLYAKQRWFRVQEKRLLDRLRQHTYIVKVSFSPLYCIDWCNFLGEEKYIYKEASWEAFHGHASYKADQTGRAWTRPWTQTSTKSGPVLTKARNELHARNSSHQPQTRIIFKTPFTFILPLFLIFIFNLYKKYITIEQWSHQTANAF